MRVIRGRKALVTGAASGIGRALALALAKEGADLFLADIDSERLMATAREAREARVVVETHVCDLADTSQIAELVAHLREAWGGLNILINNAGIAYYGPTHLMTEEQLERLLAVNLLAPVRLTSALLPVLLAAEEAHILNMCSMFGLVSWRKTVAYQTSKFGLVGFTAGLRADYYRKHFGVTALCPGFVHSRLIEDYAAANPNNRRSAPPWLCTTPEKVAIHAVRAIRRDRGLVVITPAAHFWWRLMRFGPGLADWLIREGWRRRPRIKV